MIFWRDLREIGVSLVMVPVWFYLIAKHSLPWTAYLMVPALLWVAGFMLVDRWRHKRRRPEPGEPLGQRVASSLAQVEHQIWLLRNVVWWYLLPPGLAMLAFFGQIAWVVRDGGWWIVLVIAGMTCGGGGYSARRLLVEPARRSFRAGAAPAGTSGLAREPQGYRRTGCRSERCGCRAWFHPRRRSG